MPQGPTIHDVGHVRPEDVLHFQQAVTRQVWRDLLKNAWNARAFLLPLVFWVLAMSVYCCFARGGWHPQFVVNQFSNGGVSQTVAGFDASPAGLLRALYYNAAMLSSVGAADFTPFNTASRVVALLDSIAGVVTLGLVVSLLALSLDQRPDGQSSQAGDAPSPGGGGVPSGEGPAASAFMATGPVTSAGGTSFRDAVMADAAAQERDARQELRDRGSDAARLPRQAVVLSGWQASIETSAQSLINGIDALIATASKNNGDTKQPQEESVENHASHTLRIEMPLAYVHEAFEILLDLQSLADRLEVSALAHSLNKILIASRATRDGLAVEIAHALRIKEILHAAGDIAFAIVEHSTIVSRGPAGPGKRL